MKIEQITKALELVESLDEKSEKAAPEGQAVYKIGEKYFIRTVTMYYTGRLTKVTDKELVLEDVAWIAHTGDFSKALASGEFSDVEPYPNGEVIIGRGAVIDVSVFNHALPREVK